MIMFEFRWKSTHPIIKHYVLQYRVKFNKTVYAGLGPFPETTVEMVWSDWIDVPYVD